MRFKFETRRHGRCQAEAEQRGDKTVIEIWWDENSDPKRVGYVLHIKDLPLPKQIPEGGALQDAVRIAVNHFESFKTKDGDDFEFHCSRITMRWNGKLYNKMGG